MVTPDAVQTTLSANASHITGGGWLNLRVIVKPSDTGLNLASIQLGPFDLPSDLVLPTLGLVLDVALGDNLGQVLIKSIDGIAINGETIDLSVAYSGHLLWPLQVSKCGRQRCA